MDWMHDSSLLLDLAYNIIVAMAYISAPAPYFSYAILCSYYRLQFLSCISHYVAEYIKGESESHT